MSEEEPASNRPHQTESHTESKEDAATEMKKIERVTNSSETSRQPLSLLLLLTDNYTFSKSGLHHIRERRKEKSLILRRAAQ